MSLVLGPPLPKSAILLGWAGWQTILTLGVVFSLVVLLATVSLLDPSVLVHAKVLPALLLALRGVTGLGLGPILPESATLFSWVGWQTFLALGVSLVVFVLCPSLVLYPVVICPILVLFFVSNFFIMHVLDLFCVFYVFC